MSKTQEALKLALEALEAKGDAWIVLERKAKAAIREALAEQPAQQQDGPINEGWQITVAHGHSGYGVYAHMEDYPEEGAVLVQAIEQPAQQQEPVAKVDYKQRDGFRWLNYLGWQRIPDGASLYTFPPAQQHPDLSHLRPVTQEEIRAWIKDGTFFDRAIGAMHDQEKRLMAYEKAQQQEPLFWYRPCSNGMYEGPIHNAQIERVRKESGAWHPLYTSPPAQRKPWVGLTEWERGDCVDRGVARGDGWAAILEEVEAKLREKNAAPCKPLTDEQFATEWHRRTGRIMGTDKMLLLQAKYVTEAVHGIKEAA